MYKNEIPSHVILYATINIFHFLPFYLVFHLLLFHFFPNALFENYWLTKKYVLVLHEHFQKV